MRSMPVSPGGRSGPAAAATRVRVAVCAALLVSAGALPAIAGQSATEAERAVALYDRERYDEARPLFQKLDATGGLDGPMLYRLAFCLDRSGDAQGSHAILERAVTALEKEVGSAKSLEPAFYLANAYRGLKRAADTRRVAEQATAAFDSGDAKPPEDPLERFRLAKLYSERGDLEKARRWYGEALPGLEAHADAYPAYIRWSRRWLANVALGRGDDAEAVAQLTALRSAGLAEQADWDRLAVAHARQGDWKAARDAWRESERANPAEADRARYCWRLAAQAAKLGTLPERAPDDRPWRQLDRSALESVLKKSADRVTEIQTRAAAEGTSDAERKALGAELVTLHGTFVAAALEYAGRNFPIRQTAFFGGYAPLIFHENRWELKAGPPAPPASGS